MSTTMETNIDHMINSNEFKDVTKQLSILEGNLYADKIEQEQLRDELKTIISKAFVEQCCMVNLIKDNTNISREKTRLNDDIYWKRQ